MDQIKLLMIDPSITYGGFNSFGTTASNSIINHGIALLATIAENAGFNVRILDSRKLKNWDEFDKKILELSPDVIGIGFRTLDFLVAKLMSIKVKRLLPNVITVIGGLHVTIALDDVLSDDSFNKSIDYIIKGEGEVTFLNLLKTIRNNEKSERILEGVRPNLEDLPFINRELYDYSGELNNPIWFGKKPFITMLFSRGCNYNCAFCQPCERILFGSKKRFRSVNNVLKELELLKKKYKFNYIHFHDDNFIQNRKWIEEFIEKYPKYNFNSKFVIQTRADLIVMFEEYIKELAEIGCDAVSIGFESGSDRVLKFLRKGTTVLQNIKAAKICKKYNLKIIANYMYGVPTETKREMIATKRLIDAIKPDFRSMSVFTPMPGADLFDYCIEKGYYEDNKDFTQYFRNFSDKGIKGVNYKFIKKIIYSPKENFRRMLYKNKFSKILRAQLLQIIKKYEDHNLAQIIYRSNRMLKERIFEKYDD